MKRQDILMFLSTFLVGVASGVYIYFAGYSPVTTVVEEKIDDWVVDLVIVGEAYGGCQMTDTCPSFRIATDGSYRYFYHPRGSEGQVLREGQLTRSLLSDLRTVLVPQQLELASEPIEPALCASFTDGIDVRYRITYDETEYVVDSCGTAVDGEGDMWRTLGSIWTYFETVS